MSSNDTFTIWSIGAPLVEVDGDAPCSDRLGGLHVPDGVPATAPIVLFAAGARCWRVDGVSTAPVTIAVTDIPTRLRAALRLRRCVSGDPSSGVWKDLGDSQSNRVTAHGGDLVVVAFETL